MRLTLVRHATVVIEAAGARLLVDPVLDPVGAQPPLPDTAHPAPNPLVDLPTPAEDVVAGLDAVIVTHLHPDHFDQTAIRLLPRDLPVLCQPHEEGPLAGLGLNAVPLAQPATLGPLRVTATSGRHGRGPIADAMGPVMGVVVAAADEPTLYLAGDTVWCDEVEAAIDGHRPSVVVVNAGDPQFARGGSLTMDAGDVIATARAAPGATIVAVHMEAYNHCRLGRNGLARACAEAGCADRVIIPDDGQSVDFAAAG